MTLSSPLPNPRVQRTRPCASLRGSPLTRHPLGTRVATVGAISALLGIACARRIVDYTIMVTGVVVDQVGQPVRDAHVTVDFPITVVFDQQLPNKRVQETRAARCARR